jgi:hypothetical protein
MEKQSQTAADPATADPGTAAQAAQATAAPAFDPKAFEKSFEAMLEKHTKPLHEKIAQLEGKTAPVAKATTEAAAPKAITAEELTTMLDKREAARAATESANRTRSAFIEKSLKGIPAAYLKDLPATEDQSVLVAAGEAIRTQYREDLKANGFKVPDVTGKVTTGNPPNAAVVDKSKLSPMQKIMRGFMARAPKIAPKD